MYGGIFVPPVGKRNLAWDCMGLNLGHFLMFQLIAGTLLAPVQPAIIYAEGPNTDQYIPYTYHIATAAV